MTAGTAYGLDPAKNNQTGYFRRKGIDERLKGQLGMDGSNTIFFRYAEVLLNFAEAKIELNQIDQQTIDAIDKVRQRAGLPTLMKTYNRQLSQDEIREIVRRERRVELAFETKRYWDIIRWKTADIVMNQPSYGVKVADNNGEITLTKVVVKNNEFLKKNYLFPIYRNWIDSNPAIKAQNGGPDGLVNGQNPGY